MIGEILGGLGMVPQLRLACPICGSMGQQHLHWTVVYEQPDSTVIAIPFKGQSCGHNWFLVFSNKDGQCTCHVFTPPTPSNDANIDDLKMN
jgi:hypothetical protein